jgi:DNA-binding transcriptional regulator YiaG
MKIKEIREKLLFTQFEFATEIGVSFRTIQNWEQGISKPSIRLKRKLIEYCKSKGLEIDSIE